MQHRTTRSGLPSPFASMFPGRARTRFLVQPITSRWKAGKRRDGAWVAAVLFLCVLGAAAALHPTSARQRLDAMALDATQRAVRAIAPRPAPSDVVIVGIDVETERRFPQPFALWHRP